MKLYRHGDVILREVEELPVGTKLPHLVLAEGEVTGHAHRFEADAGALWAYDDKTYLEVTKARGALTHEEHKTLEIPHGNYEVIIQREYDDKDEWRQVSD